MKTGIAWLLCLVPLLAGGAEPDAAHRFDPPWGRPPGANEFTVPGVENVPDLHGDIVNPQLVVFFAGNQFMVVDDLVEDFKRRHPEITRVFLETLPPGVLAEQMESGSLTIGRMKIALQPDIFASGKSQMAALAAKFSRQEMYARNRLAIMVAKGNPKKIGGLADLGRPDVKISMPNPAKEDVGKRIEEAYVKAGGETLRKAILETKVDGGSTYLTQIHHRQTPIRVLYGESDAGPVWHTEVAYQLSLGHPVDEVVIPEQQNITATYVAGQLKAAPHPKTAQLFLDYLVSPEAGAIYKKYEFLGKE